MLQIRGAERADAALIVALIEELAAFEKLSDACFASHEGIETWLFGPTPKAHALIAQWDGKPAAFALYFYNFSTFLSKPGLYLEDLFVRPEFRRKGIARHLFQHLARIAVAEGCGRFEWSVLDWNTDAIQFYEGLGAVSRAEWISQRLDGEALRRLAAA